MKARPTRSLRLWLALLLLALGLAGCATTIVGADPNLLKFIEDGITTRQQVMLTLGQPSAIFRQEQILTYRIGEDPKQGLFIVNPSATEPWARVRYSLVLVFDDQGTLRKHSVVPVE